MEAGNNVIRMKELINILIAANKAYYCDDAPIMSDREYDALFDELSDIENKTGISFANSPTKKVGGVNKGELKKVNHSKPMLSAKKTKSIEELVSFAGNQPVILSWKLDGLTIVIRYKNGLFTQAITRGEDGLIGEDITHTVRHMGNVPMKVDFKGDFEVRGEGIISWTDYKLLNRNNEDSNPRNVVAGAVRALTPNRGNLSHMDFIAFELIMPDDSNQTKNEQLNFLLTQDFQVVDHDIAMDGDCIKEMVANRFRPELSIYPVDGIIAEFNDLDFGRSLGTTSHHENRMIALKWADDTYETTFRKVIMTTTRNGKVSLVAEFDPVNIEGGMVTRAALASVSNFEKFKFGEGDKIKVYKANMVIPQIAENITQSGTYKLSEYCSCCGSKLSLQVSASGVKNLYCPNDACISRGAQKIARFCDVDAMNIRGLSATVLEQLMEEGIVKNFVDLFYLPQHIEKIVSFSGFGVNKYENIVEAVEKSRTCHMAQFLNGIGIPLMSMNSAKAIDKHFLGSWKDFEKAINEKYPFYHIDNVSEALHRNIYDWYFNEQEEKNWRPVLKELSFIENAEDIGKDGNPFYHANVVVTGTVNGMNRGTVNELLELLGAYTSNEVTKNTTYLIVGADPGRKKLSMALMNETKIITEGQFAKMIESCEMPDDEDK